MTCNDARKPRGGHVARRMRGASVRRSLRCAPVWHDVPQRARSILAAYRAKLSIQIIGSARGRTSVRIRVAIFPLGLRIMRAIRVSFEVAPLRLAADALSSSCGTLTDDRTVKSMVQRG